MRDALERVVRFCQSGFAQNNPAYYVDIDAALADVEQTEDVQTMRRLAQGGPSLTSKRFAYPHIEDRAHDLLSTLPAAA